MLKQLTIFSALVTALLFSACGGMGGMKVEMVNPLDTTIVVTIDEETFTLEADSAMSTRLPAGTHKLTVKTVTDSLVKDVEFDLEDKGPVILNICGIEYVKEFVYYSTSENYDILNSYTFKYDTMSFEGVRAEAVGSKDDLLVYGSWDYGLTDEVPETISTTGYGGVWKEKVQRMDDFVLILQISEILENFDFEEMGDLLDEEEGMEEEGMEEEGDY